MGTRELYPPVMTFPLLVTEWLANIQDTKALKINVTLHFQNTGICKFTPC